MPSSRTTMLPRTHRTTTKGKEYNNNLTWRPQSHQHNKLLALSMSRKRRREPPSKVSFSDADETSSSTDMLDMLDSDQDSDYSDDNTTPQSRTSELRSTHVTHIADRAFPALRKHMTNACYIKPPDHRIPTTRKRRRVLLETDDPADRSTVLIVRVDGYLPLACPLSPSHCALQHSTSTTTTTTNTSLRSIPAVIRHLAKHHRPPLYCPVCGALFDMALSRDAHIQARSCARREFEMAQGVSRSQLEALIRGDDPSQPEEERWWRIYGVLFPTATKPPSGAAYLSEGMPLAVAMASDYWDCYGRDVVEEYFADEVVAGGAEITGQEVSVLCGFVGKELVQRVVAGGLGDEMPKVAGGVGSLDETEWESVKADEG